MKRVTALSLCQLLVAIVASSAPVSAADTIRVNGSGSALDMMKPIVAAYRKVEKDVQIVMEKPLGSSGAIKALLAGALDLVVSSKPLRPEDGARGAQLQHYGKTPLVLIAEKKVRQKDVTTKELEGIFNGTVTTWPGGETIRVVLRPREDVDSKILGDLSPGMAHALTAARARSGMIVAVTDPEASSAVAATPGGFGATGLTSIIVDKLPVATLSFNGVKASPKTVANGSYPLEKEISLVTAGKTSAAAKRLISFMLSPQGRAIAAKNGVLVTAETGSK